MAENTMGSNRPYLVRAFYEWIVDNDCTPFLLVDATKQDVVVPTEYIKDGRIILNLGPSAVQGLSLGNDAIVFSARFSGREHELYIPVISVIAVYAKENGQGMVFNEGGSEPPPSPPSAPDGSTPSNTKKRPNLKVVK